MSTNPVVYNQIEDHHTTDLITSGVDGFFKVMDGLDQDESFYEFFTRFTEASFMHLFTQGLLKTLDSKRYTFLSELGVTKSEETWGRLDLMIRDKKNKQIYLIEAKSFWSSELEPTSKHWTKEATTKYYEDLFSQCQQYQKEEMLYRDHEVTLIALVFSRVEFYKKEHIEKWDFKHPDYNEFYGFKHYANPSFTSRLGIAVYGKVEKV